MHQGNIYLLVIYFHKFDPQAPTKCLVVSSDSVELRPWTGWTDRGQVPVVDIGIGHTNTRAQVTLLEMKKGVSR